jgi:L-cystine transport system ATP-binding protein
MIKIRNLHKHFKDKHVLKGIDVNVEKGETVAILGPSGSGKSTLLRCINLLEIPSKGEIDLEDIKVQANNISKKDKLTVRRNTAMVFQSYNLFPHMTALENVIEGLTTVKKISKEDAVKVGEKYINKVGLADRIDYYPSQLSGGQQQRVAIARALALNPKVILMDEPTSALDPELVHEVLSVIKDISKEDVTLIIVTHELDFARNVADKIIFMDEGLVVEEGTPREFFLNPKKERTVQFLNKYNQQQMYYI